MGGRRSSKPRKRRARLLQVVEVIDGDTVETDRLGRVRLIGVDTPERGACFDDAATRFTRSRLEGRRVRAELGAEREDPYGRTLAYLYRGGMHNLALVRRGYARALTIPPNDKYASRFEAAERRAKVGDEGQWASCEGGHRSSSAPDPPRRGGRQNRDGRSGGRLPPPPPDLDCSDLPGPIAVGTSDPHRLDADGDGTGCDD